MFKWQLLLFRFFHPICVNWSAFYTNGRRTHQRLFIREYCVWAAFHSNLLWYTQHQTCLKSRKTPSNVSTKLSAGGLKVDLYLVDISKRSLTELTLQPVAPVLSSSCSQPNELSNQFMVGSRRRLLRNCFISIDTIERH